MILAVTFAVFVLIGVVFALAWLQLLTEETDHKDEVDK